MICQRKPLEDEYYRTSEFTMSSGLIISGGTRTVGFSLLKDQSCVFCPSV